MEDGFSFCRSLQVYITGSESNVTPLAEHLFCRPFMPPPNLTMVPHEHPRFWRIQSPESSKVTESYCLGCSTFVGASQSLVNLRLVELLHRARCEEMPKAGPQLTR
jgi:hypothetical protein